MQTLSLPEDPTQTEVPSPPVAMPFLSHLEELRTRLIWCAVAVGVMSTLTFFYAPALIRILQHSAPKTVDYIQLYPGEEFLSSFKLCLLTGLGLALPILLYHVARFTTPGLSLKEKRLIFPLLMVSTVLFAAGVVFGYYAVLPFMLDFLLGYGQEIARNQLSIAKYLDFCMGFLLASGLVFQLPVLLLFLSFFKLITSQKLINQWKWAIVGSFIVGAVITPSADPFSQTFMAIALLGLYGISILLIKACGR
jgi:sec-independent protein translocase protein TatC